MARRETQPSKYFFEDIFGKKGRIYSFSQGKDSFLPQKCISDKQKEEIWRYEGYMTHLYLIRHGEAMSALKGFVGDGGLSPLGIQQAERLRDRLAASNEIQADVLIASTLPRARQTAEIIAPGLGLPFLLDDTIQELHPGEADGMTLSTFRETFGEPDYEVDPYHPMAPGGENWGQFMLRAGTALDRIIRHYVGKTIVLVCHGGIIDGSFLYFFKVSAWTLPSARFYTRNTSITHWQQILTEKGVQRWHLITYNDAFHLHDIGAFASIPWGRISPHPHSDQDRPAVPIETEAFTAREQRGDETTQTNPNAS